MPVAGQTASGGACVTTQSDARECGIPAMIIGGATFANSGAVNANDGFIARIARDPHVR